MKNRKGILLMIIGLICLIAVTVGVTYAFFSYVKEGTTENTVTTGTIEFLYTEVDKVGAGISIEDAFPMSDAQGKAQTGSGNEFNFKVTSKLTGNFDIPYTVTARKKTVENVLDDSAVRIYLADTTGEVEKELLLDNYGDLENYNEAPSGITEKVIYTGLVPTGSTNYEKDFTLKMWIDENVDFSPVKDEEGNDIYPYNGKTFTITVNVYAEAKVVTDSEIDMANTTNIDNITVNDPSIQVEEVDNEEYDYLANVENEVDSVSLDIETTNPEAEVEVTRIEEETAYSTKSKIQRLSTKVTFDLEEGDNLFNIKVLSANKQVEKEYVLNIYRELSSYEATLETSTYTATSGRSCSRCSVVSLSNYGNCILANGTPSTDSNYHAGSCANGKVLSNSICGYGVSVGSTLEYDCKTVYSCPKGGTLSGTTCTVQEYTCPNGGTLEGTICVQ